MAEPDNMDELTLKQLDVLLMNSRKIAVEAWPYSGTGDQVRRIEAEYKRRGIQLPEDRAAE